MRSDPLPLYRTSTQNTSSLTGINGIVEKRIDSDTYSVKTMSGALIIKIKAGQLVPGDRITISQANKTLTVDRSGELIKTTKFEGADSFAKRLSPSAKLNDLLYNLNLSLQTDDSDAIDKNVKVLASHLATEKNSEPLQSQDIVKSIETTLNTKSNTLPKETIQEIKRLLQTLRASAGTGTSLSIILPADSNLEEGLYTSASLTEVLKSLKSPLRDNAIVQKLLSTLENQNNLIFRIDGSTTRGFSISTLNQEDTTQALLSFSKNLKSSLFQSIPVESLSNLLTMRENLPFNTLRELDSLVLNSSIKFPLERAGNTKTANAAIDSWLSNVLDSVSLQKNPLQHIPVNSATRIISDVSAIAEQIHSGTTHQSIPLQHIGITEELLNSSGKFNSIPSIIQKLGFTLEAELLQQGYLNPATNLKAELLKLSQSGMDESNYQMSNNPQPTDKIKGAAELNDNQKETLSSSLKIVNQFQNELDQILKNAITGESNKKPLQLLNDSLQILNIISTKIGVQAPAIAAYLKEQLQNLNELVQLASKVNDTTDQLFVVANKKLSETIETITKWFTTNTDEQKQQAAINDIISSGKNSTLSSLSQHIESSINRLESLQLLSRQTNVSDGQQQMLALPMKIGDEWTEVNITFLKKKSSSKKKKSQSSSISVYLNVAPKKLGPISIQMDYLQKKSLKVSMSFDLDSTKNYFKKFGDEIKSTLRDLGFPLCSIDIRKKKNKNEPPDDVKLDTLIDLKV